METSFSERSAEIRAKLDTIKKFTVLNDTDSNDPSPKEMPFRPISASYFKNPQNNFTYRRADLQVDTSNQLTYNYHIQTLHSTREKNPYQKEITITSSNFSDVKEAMEKIYSNNSYLPYNNPMYNPNRVLSSYRFVNPSDDLSRYKIKSSSIETKEKISNDGLIKVNELMTNFKL